MTGWWQVQSRRFPVLGRVDMISRGPVWADPGPSANWVAHWRRRHDGRPLILNAQGIDAGALRAGGFWPLMTPASVALLPLGPEEAMRRALLQKWRNRLNRAEEMGLRITRAALKPGHWLLRAEDAQRKTRRYAALPPGLSLAFARANPGQVWLYEAREWTEPVAAMLFLRHGRMASYQIGVTLDRGRATGAHNLLLWRAMRDLSAAGHSLLDLGTLNSQDAPGLVRFKLGTGARVERLGGTWLWHSGLAPLARHLPGRFTH